MLVRADLNVPMQGTTVTDMTRIERFVPTVRDLCTRGARVVIMSHLGRPGGQVTPALSLAPVAEAMAQALGAPVQFIPHTVGGAAKARAAGLGNGDVALLENLRFYREETDNNPDFASQLAALADVYVNDAFSCSHRAHASTAAITALLPAYAGPSLVREIEALSRALDRPEHPVAALVGGAKVSSKIAILEHLLAKMDVLIIGGGMANTFLAAQGYDVGASLCERDFLDTARSIVQAARADNCTLVLPVDGVVAKAFAANAPHRTVDCDSIPGDQMMLDVGPQSVAVIRKAIEGCKTLLWNGPLGAFEIAPFDRATVEVAQYAAERTGDGALVSIAGGGDTVAALRRANVTDAFTYVSTAGGAFLQWLEGKELPAIAALNTKGP